MKKNKALKFAVLAMILLAAKGYSQSQPQPPLFSSSILRPDRAREPRKETLDDLFPRGEFKETVLPPLSLKPGRIPGLNQAAIDKLNLLHFVVVNDARTSDFASVYKQNRVDGLPNFVTVASIMHPLLAHRNAIKVAVVNKSCFSQLKSLLEAMVAASVADYRETEDEDVKDDIQRNLAYLSVALRLIAPEDKPTEFGGVEELVRQDLDNIHKERMANSAIFKRPENFAAYRPFGWYETSDKLKNFYRARQWLGRMCFSLTDVTNNTKAGTGNEFRRAVLLYRSLIRAKPGNQQGYSAWDKLHKTLMLVEDSEVRQGSIDLLPEDFATAFLATEKNLQLTLEALSNPLNRTKLLLSLKGAETRRFSPTSIFELNAKNQKDDRNLIFRVFPSLNPPEFDWINGQIVQDKDETTGFNTVPVSLVLLHARGSDVANTILADNTWRLDEDLIFSVPILDRMVNIVSQGASVRSIWQTLANYVKPLPDGPASPLRTNTWLGFCLEGSIASWLDSWIALDPSALGAKDANPAKPNKGGQGPPPIRKMSNFNYLEPAPDVFKRMSASLLQFSSGLVELGVFPPEMKERTADFCRLGERFSEIAKKELTNQSLGPDDALLLANIDRLLEKISSPVAGSLFVSYGTPLAGQTPDHPQSQVGDKPAVVLRSRSQANQIASTGKSAPAISKFQGVNFGLGGPGSLYIVLKSPRGPVVCRGAAYAFYETPGSPLSIAHWQRRLDYGLLKPPFWCDPFQLVDDSTTKH